MLNCTILGPNLADQTHGDFIVHRTGCSDIARVRLIGGAPATEQRGSAWTIDADDLTTIAADVYSDFIDEGSMTVEDALGSIHFAPCVTLPEVTR